MGKYQGFGTHTQGPVFVGQDTGNETTSTLNPTLNVISVTLSANARSAVRALPNKCYGFDINFATVSAWTTLGQGLRIVVSGASGGLNIAAQAFGGTETFGRLTPNKGIGYPTNTITFDVTASVAASAGDIAAGKTIVQYAYYQVGV